MSNSGGGASPAGPSSEHLYSSSGVGGVGGVGGFPSQNALNIPPFPLANRTNKRPRLNVHVPTPLLSNGGVMSTSDNGTWISNPFSVHKIYSLTKPD